MVIQIQRIVILVTCIFFLSDDKKIALGHGQACNVLSYKHGEIDDFMKRCTVIASTSTRKTLVGLSCT